jgi:amino acid permease
MASADIRVEQNMNAAADASGFVRFVGICVAQTNSLFSADARNNITFTAGEVKNPRRNIPLSVALIEEVNNESENF